ncbi:MAG: hypothetical protein IKD35_05105 [Clostridia bacterium]|nr:hypothetical protein [Clostridia bacterium]
MEKLLIGTAVNTHGIRGEVKINPCCDLTDQLLTLKKVWIGETEYACEGRRNQPRRRRGHQVLIAHKSR